ncbi:MAG: MarR family winged helix-turn-helix transcriptional regulator [Nitratireductor sp.]|nr:winged helix-turn-helix transcriptional regulator [Nitratireductor sp.]
MGNKASLTGKLIYTARLCRTARAELLLTHGLYAGQDILLKSLSEEDGQTMGSLATNLGVKPPTVTKMVTRMESQGLVRREGSQYDSRINHVFITPAGTALLGKVDDAWEAAELAAFTGLKDKDEKRLHKILDRVLSELDGKYEPAQD